MSTPTHTAVEARALLEQAERDHLAAAAVYGEALLVKQVMPERDVTFERDAVASALERVEALKVLLPLIEQAEEAQLAQARAKLDADRDRKLRKSLAELHKQSLHLTAAYSNVVGSFNRMMRAAEDATFFLSPKQRDYASGGLAARLSAPALKAAAEVEINRLGLLPSLAEGTSAPGTTPASVPLNFRSAPRRLPELATEMKSLSSALLNISPPPPAPEETV